MKTILTLLFLSLALHADTKPLVKPAEAVVVPFELVSSGHFIVKVKLDGNGPYNLIFDTGAPTSLISPRIAKDAGLLAKAKDKPLIPLFGMMGNAQIAKFQVGSLVAENTSAQIMDHPTVKLFSEEYKEKYGSIEGIVGFPFFSQFRMSVDYAKKELTFVPNGYKSEDVMQAMMNRMMSSMSGKQEPKIVGAGALLGFDIQNDDDDEANGVIVSNVFPESPAAKAGLKKGDKLLTIGGRWTDTVDDTLIAASFVKPKQKAVVEILRGGKSMVLTVVPASGF
ncbi:MAG: PDZ domain-containing protein [Zavarzinella sp.]